MTQLLITPAGSGKWTHEPLALCPIPVLTLACNVSRTSRWLLHDRLSDNGWYNNKRNKGKNPCHHTPSPSPCLEPVSQERWHARCSTTSQNCPYPASRCTGCGFIWRPVNSPTCSCRNKSKERKKRTHCAHSWRTHLTPEWAPKHALPTKSWPPRNREQSLPATSFQVMSWSGITCRVPLMMQAICIAPIA